MDLWEILNIHDLCFCRSILPNRFSLQASLPRTLELRFGTKLLHATVLGINENLFCVHMLL